MRLLHKLILMFTALAFLPLLLMTGLLLGSHRQRLMDAGRAHVLSLAVNTAERVDLLVDRTVEQVEQLTVSPHLVEQLELANLRYRGMTQSAAAERLGRLDGEWVAAADPAELELAQQVLDSPLAAELRRFQQTAPRRYAELMVTDLYGGLVAATNPTTDYYQADEGWWQTTYADGQGETFVSDIGFDRSAGVFSLDVAAPVRDGAGEVVGVVKISHDVRAIFEVVRRLRVGDTGAACVVDAEGRTVFGGGGEADDVRLEAEEMAALRQERSGVFVGPAGGTGPDRVVAFDVLRSPLRHRAAGTDRSEWFVVVTQAASEVYEPSRKALVGSAAVLVLPVGGLVLLAVYLEKRLVEPVRALHWASQQVAAGQLDVRVQIEQGDEMQEVGYQFNRMAAALQRHEEEQRLEIRRRTEELRQSDMQSRRMRSAVSAQMSCISDGMLRALDQMRRASEGGLSAEENSDLATEAWITVRAFTEDLRDLCKVESGQMRLQPESLRLGDAIESARRLLGAVLRRHQVELVAEPETAEMAVTADRARLKQILYSLLSNAVSYGGMGSEVRVCAERRDGEVEVAVTDDGPGIPPPMQQAIFDPVRAQDTPPPTSPEGRLGLNLPMTRHLVELHGGRIWVESEPGEGSTFRFTLPEETPGSGARP
jgi:signal transduction histidine kinase